MSNFGPPFPPPEHTNGHRVHNRHSSDFKSHGLNGSMSDLKGNGPMPVPNGRMSNGQGQDTRGAPGNGAFAGARSPPNNKNTQHVPCKFYRQGQCQAGRGCQFLHTDEPVVDAAPCKYFQKGNCKFGAKCALAHILPNGQRVNKTSIGMPRRDYDFGPRAIPPPPPGSISLLSTQAQMAPSQGPSPYQYPPDDHYGGPTSQRHQYDIPTIDTTVSSYPGSAYGSPPNDARLSMSPMQKGLSVLDAPLPASFDSQGISHMARYGPIAASVPSRFGLESTSPSSVGGRPSGESSALRNLHESAFGNGTRTSRAALGTSPTTEDEVAAPRALHSQRFASRTRMPMSQSLGTRGGFTSGDEWDRSNAPFEEEMLPSSLNELLTDKEKLRRFSRNAEDEATLNHRRSVSGMGSPLESNSKVGSPSGLGTSPSRFSPFFTRKTSDQPDAGAGASSLGHVGSPLRNSSLHPNGSPSLRAISRSKSGDISPFGVSSPPRQASMSMLTQELQRSRISSRPSDTNEPTSNTQLPPPMNRVASGSSVGSTGGMSVPGRLDRAISSGSIGRERIDEEQGLFPMEEEEGARDSPSGTAAPRNIKRYSGGWLGTLGQRNSSGGPSPNIWGSNN